MKCFIQPNKHFINQFFMYTKNFLKIKLKKKKVNKNCERNLPFAKSG